MSRTQFCRINHLGCGESTKHRSANRETYARTQCLGEREVVHSAGIQSVNAFHVILGAKGSYGTIRHLETVQLVRCLSSPWVISSLIETPEPLVQADGTRVRLPLFVH